MSGAVTCVLVSALLNIFCEATLIMIILYQGRVIGKLLAREHIHTTPQSTSSKRNLSMPDRQVQRMEEEKRQGVM